MGLNKWYVMIGVFIFFFVVVFVFFLLSMVPPTNSVPVAPTPPVESECARMGTSASVVMTPDDCFKCGDNGISLYCENATSVCTSALGGDGLWYLDHCVAAIR